MDKVISHRPKYVFGNWKMNGSRDLVQRLTETLRETTIKCPDVEMVICPPFTLLDAVHQAVHSKGWALGGQDVSNEPDGAFTGAVSARMLDEVGCRYCLVGHSESRRFGGVTSADIVKKIQQLVSHDIVPVFCIGETRKEREAGDPERIVLTQVDEVLGSFTGPVREHLIVAYEPVWAIGSGLDNVASQVGVITQAIRSHLEREVPNPILLFGGSVTDGNIQEVVELPGVDGVLVGGASLKPESFGGICKGLQARVLDELRLVLSDKSENKKRSSQKT